MGGQVEQGILNHEVLKISIFDILESIFDIQGLCRHRSDESRPYDLFASLLPGKPNISFTLGRTLDLWQLSA